jgi:hypothetical protein
MTNPSIDGLGQLRLQALGCAKSSIPVYCDLPKSFELEPDRRHARGFEVLAHFQPVGVEGFEVAAISQKCRQFALHSNNSLPNDHWVL